MAPAAGPSPPGERIVLRWFLVVFFTVAALTIAFTVWTRHQECRRTCAAQGKPPGELRLSGGGRIGMRVECRCGRAA